MSKRPHEDGHARPRSKRSKHDAQQSRLDRFFSPALVAGGSPEHPNGGPQPAKSVQGDDKTRSASREVIDVDPLEEAAEATLPSAMGDKMSSGPLGLRNVSQPSNVIAVSSVQSTRPLAFASLDQDPITYDIDSQTWSTASTPYSFLTHVFTTLSQTRSRITIANTLTNALRTILVRDRDSLISALYLLSNTLTPPYVETELGIGPSLLSQCIQQTSGLSSIALKRLYNRLGDPGDVAFEAKSKMRTLVPHPPLLVPSLYNSMLAMAGMKGPGMMKDKQRVITKLLVSSRGEETRYLVRTLSQNLRVGAVRTSILVALARAMVLTLFDSAETYNTYHISSHLLSTLRSSTCSKSELDQAKAQLNAVFARAERLLKRVYARHPCYDDIVEALLRGGLDGLESRVPLEIGIPLHPTLGSPARSLDEIYDVLGDRPFSTEFKYDGQRAQIHGQRRGDGSATVKIFSRHLEDMTAKYPDVVALMEHLLEVAPQSSSFIIDSEIVAIDPVTERLKSFQELSNRARKVAQLEEVRIVVGVFAFDIMYLDGEALVGRPFRDRRTLLRTRFPPLRTDDMSIARFRHVESCESKCGRDVIMKFWERAVESSCEGLMIKLLYNDNDCVEGTPKKGNPRRKPLPATYEPDKRTAAWLKLKKDYVEGLGDSLDLVPIGAWYGNGRKVKWWSPILLGVWDPDIEKFVAVCKCMSGFTDTFYKALMDRYPLVDGSVTCSERPVWDCDTGGYQPDVYFKPQEVWEIRGADVTISPTSAAARGIGADGRGLSVRFPRYIKTRSDKSIGQASTPAFLETLWRKQSLRGKVNEEELAVGNGEAARDAGVESPDQ
ncbi:hypothetical protein AX16_005196 [Volvariella volvacea WC 439]|nr:hypothetical protein AX16_005196 [Volvariella volvacea WC 439]